MLSITGGLRRGVGGSSRRSFGDDKRLIWGRLPRGGRRVDVSLFDVMHGKKHVWKFRPNGRRPSRDRGHHPEAPLPSIVHRVKDWLVAQEAPQGPRARRAETKILDGVRTERNRGQ